MELTAQLRIDDREAGLWDLLQTRRVVDAGMPLTVTRERLLVGDASLQLPGITGPLVMERKRADDLVASAADGRLARQWHASADAPPILYLVVVEEMGSRAATRLARRAAAARGTAARRGDDLYTRTWLQLSLEACRAEARRLVVRTADLAETAEVLLLCGLLLWKRQQDPGYVPTCLTERLHAPAVPKGVSVFVRQLCCQPGVSLGRARVVAGLLPADEQHMAGLCRWLTTEDGAARLVGRLGPSVGRRLLLTLLGDGAALPCTERKRRVGEKTDAPPKRQATEAGADV